MKSQLPCLAFIQDGANTQVIVDPTLEGLVMDLFEKEIESPTTIIHDGRCVHFEQFIYRWCFIKGKITVEELLDSVELKPSEIHQRLRVA